ncbi:MAG: VWA domain-containing protein [Candidatus Aminicenantales bacterium]
MISLLAPLPSSPLQASQTSHEVTVVNITVPVRVFDGDRFVDSLRLEDFEVQEDGRPQPVQAVYLIRGRAVERQEGPLPASVPPPTARHFVLLFQLTEYLPEVENAVNYFFENIVRSGDGVDIVTPRTTYRLKARISTPEALNRAKREIGAKVRQDTLVDSGAYNAITKDLVDNLEGGVDLQGYALNLQRLEWLRTIEPERMAAFAAELKKIPGAKHVFLFFQKERVPQFSNKTMSEFLSSADSEAALKAMELMGHYTREIRIDPEAIRKTFADASTDVHFLYVTRTRRDEAHDIERAKVLENITMAEHSEDIYSAFREIAAATGGTSDSSWNAVDMLKKAAVASENYYLLYYRPQDYRADGNYHAITVKVKTGGYRVTHRAGYFATETGSGSATPEEKELTAPSAGKGARPADEKEILEPLGPPPAQTLLAAAADYCRRLQDAALNFVCHEQVRERLNLARTPQGGIPNDMDASRGDRAFLVVSGSIREWTYDYQLIRREGKAEETRTLLKENGKDKRQEHAQLATVRFSHSNVILGPVGLLGAKAQGLHDYGIVKEIDLDGEAVVVLDAKPKGKEASSLYGKAWVRRRDGAVLRIEWEPASLGNYEEIARMASEINGRPKISFTSEYAFEKNGLRFPSEYSVTEEYQVAGKTIRLSKTEVSYKDYKFFMVRTEVKY